ncbi:KAP family P-loop NTPase fold protein [Streptomyces venezuelae]|uniref:KAP family P-loop NTPase fold protein n=1 Tax=Streptomyces venezuelae TaxID=54571 RepID=UPI00331D755D
MTDSQESPDRQDALFAGDDPILDSGSDLLNRQRLARALVEEVQEMNATRGAVVAITGKWGSGKTSLLNLTANILQETEDVRVVDFNPWFFSGTDHLIRFFFDEMARQLSSERDRKKRLQDSIAGVAERFSRYSASLSPLKFIPGVGAVIDSAEKTAEGVTQALSSSIHEQRSEIATALKGMNGRIVVLIDDIDRLTRQEIRDLFRLVRLNGSFPNVVYLLCFDRSVVERALGEDGLDGAAYLEKIVKTSVEIPPAADEALASILQQGVLGALQGIETGPADGDRLPDVFWQVVRPLFGTVRDVKRFLSSLTLAARSVGEEVSLPDLIALEAIRVLRPAAHDLITENLGVLTTTHGWQSVNRNQAAVSAGAEVVTALMEKLPSGVGRALITYVFPAAQCHTENLWHGADSLSTWRRDRRVAHPEVLRYYLHRELPSGTALGSQVDAIFEASNDKAALRHALLAIPDVQFEDALDRFLAYVDLVEVESIGGTVTALLELFPRIAEDRPGMFDFGGDLLILRPVLRLMRRVDMGDVDRVARSVFDATPSPHARLRFISIIGRGDNESEAPLISSELEAELRSNLGQQLTSASPESLVGEKELLRTVVQAVDCDPTSGNLAIQAASAPNVVAQLLETALSVSRSNSLGSVVVRHEDRLAWDALVSVYGGVESFHAAVGEMKSSIAEGDRSPRLTRALDAYEQYAGGWRPRTF